MSYMKLWRKVKQMYSCSLAGVIFLSTNLILVGGSLFG